VNALIYGAGSAGRQVASALRQSDDIRAVAFIDDDHKLWRNSINGLPVYSPTKIPDLIKLKFGVSEILLAMPSASRSRQKDIINNLSEFPVRVSVVPSVTQLANRKVTIEDIKQVQIEDVLGRDPVEPHKDLMKINIYNKIVMVTGAGGSIGSELCRQIIVHNPKTLILFDINEFGLFLIDSELRKLAGNSKIVPILGSVLDINIIKRVISDYKVHTVLHAAAYKHVPLIESNYINGIINNVFGTKNLIEVACHERVENIVLISTDKAVRPTSIMGCSKRLAELVLQAKNIELKKTGSNFTKLTMVRFGNVLGSSGSVVPTFRNQIKLGGPITVTHPDIIRYFMTIPEAAQLVIQAAALGRGGDVMVLDMGEPVKIVDLAKRMIHLSGYSVKDHDRPSGDIEIIFTGLRPGEKLYEELLIGSETQSTEHPRIMRAMEKVLMPNEIETILSDLSVALQCDKYNDIISILKEAVPEFLHGSEG
jgi:FlaA1/EpsC-like NDP-sugar epimerase